MHLAMDPVLRIHNDPDKKLASLLVSRGADPNARNLAGNIPGESVGGNALVEGSERTLQSKVGELRSLDSVFQSYSRHKKVHDISRGQLEAGSPRPQHEWYISKPKVIPPWELPSAHPYDDKAVRDLANSLKTSRTIAKERSTILRRFASIRGAATETN